MIMRSFGRHVFSVCVIAVLLAFAGTSHAAQGDNLALGKPVTMSGGDPADPTQQGANCTDGLTGGNYPTDSICRTIGAQTGANREWIEVDLGQDYVIDRVRLWNRTDGTNGDFARWVVVTTRPSSLTGVTSDPQSTLDPAVNPSAPFVNKLAYATGNTAGTSYGTGQAAAYTSLDLHVGTHIARYVRIYSMKPAPTVLNLAEIEVFEGPPPIRTINNPSFEQPVMAAGNSQVSETLVPGWSTTEPVAVPSSGVPFVNGGDIEIWRSGFGGVIADDGSQFVELNAYSNAALSPAPLCVYPGETFTWRVSHRARGAAAQVDVARLRVNGQDVATFSDGTIQAGTHTCTPSPGFNCTAQVGSPTTAGWGRWQGTWSSALAQPAAMTFEFAAISSMGPGAGNFMDNVSITGLAAAVEFSGAATSGSESTPTANLPLLLINGPVTTAQTIQLDIVGGTATRGVDYATTPATGPITVTIPVGTYDGTAATAISLAPYIQILTDSVTEGDETILLQLSNASSGLSIAGAAGCRAGIADSTYTIVDDVTPVLTVTKTATPNPFAIGQPASYAVTVQNTGFGPTTADIVVSDTLPAGINFVGATGANWSCAGTTALTCTFTGVLAAGDSTTLTLNVNVTGAATNGNNTATASGGGDATCPAAAHCVGAVTVPINTLYVCSPSTIFVTQNTPAQLFSETYGSGSATFNPIGPVSAWNYNSAGFRTADSYIYAVSAALDAAHPVNHLLRIDPATGAVADLGAITGLPASGVNSGAFDASDNFYVGFNTATSIYRINLTTRVATAVAMTPVAQLLISDWTFANGFFWGVTNNAQSITRVNPTTGAIARYAATILPLASGYGAAWTFGNGNLGFGNNDTGTIYQVRVTTPSGTPTFTLVSSSPGPLPSVANDGTSCTSPPADLGITKTGPASSSAGGALSWTLTVTNNGAGASSGFTVVDTVPAGVTGIASPTAGCTVAGSTVTCVEGALAVGGTFNITVNGNAPNPFTAAITNTATVTGNESDAVAGNNTATQTVTPLNPTLTVTKTATPATFVIGQPASYAIAVQNTGNGPTTANFTITDTLPAGITFASAAGTSWSCTGTTTLTCTFSGTLAAGASTTLTLNVNVGATAVNGDNSATARGGGDTTCPTTGAVAAHCTDSVTVPINTQYICSPSTIFVAQGTPTQLNAETYGSGSAVFTPIGTAIWSYNAIGYRASDNFIYATSGNLDAAHPINHLLRIDPSNGVVADLGVITGAPAAGVNNGAFDAAGNYYIASGNDTTIYRVNLTTRVATAINLTPSQALGISDFAPVSGFMWNITTNSSPPTMTRLNPNNGAIARFAIPAMPIVTATGAAWTFGNGNLGVSDNTTGNVYQIRINNPTGTPTFALVNQSAGPTSGQNDGTSCVSPPIDLAIAKTGPASAAPNGAISWTLTVTNNGPAISSGYTVVDIVPAGVTNITSPTPGCTVAGNTVTCVGGQLGVGASFSFTVNGNAPTPFNTAITNTATVAGNETDPVSSNNTATETVTPLPPANVSIAKALTGESGTQPGIAEPGEQLTYTITLTNSGGLAATNYSVTDPLDPNVTFVSASNGGSLAGSVVTWNGLTVPAGGNLVLNVVVAVNNPIPSGVTRIGNAAYQTGSPPPNCSSVPQPANCTSTPTAAHITIAKTAGSPVPTGNPNEYRITYVATVTNNGGSVGTYDLSDTLTFNGATVSAISAPVYASSTGDTRTGTLGTLTPPSGGTIVTGESLSASGIETWTYAVTYQVTDPATAEDCSVPSGGLRNSAALGGAASGAPSADTCSGAPNVTILKTAAAPVPTGSPNEFTVTYTVNVLNTGTLIGIYDLSDTLDFNGATVSAISAPAYSSSSGDTQDGTLGLFGAPNGGTIVDDETISAGGTETWTYTATYTVTDAVAAQNCADPSGGLRNSAELGGSLNGESTTCTGAPAVVIGKSVSGPTPTGNPNEYTLLYQVTVQNNGTLDGTYDLSDTFTFPGVSGVVVSSVSHGGADPLATPLGTLTASGGTIVTGETIAAGASETYTYSVVFTIDDVVAVGNCALGGGLVNDAALGGSSSGQVSTCSGVPNIAILKTATTPASTGTPNQYSITYTITVNNAGEAAGTYDLADTFAFAGANVDAVSAIAHGGTDPLITTLGTLSPSGGTIVTGEPIAGGGNETYTYTVTYTITDPATANDCASPSGGLRNSAALGGSVSGNAGTCTGAPVVAVVKALAGESGTQPGIAEPGETLTYTITLTNSGSADAANFAITDSLDPNTTFVSADNGGALVGGNVEWTGLAIPAGGNLVLTVVVTVNTPIPPGVTDIGNVAYETGTTPPSCPPAGPQCVVTPTAAIVTTAKALTGESGTQPGIAEPGEQLTYTITLTNSGGSAATGYGETDQLDANTSFVSASNGGTFAAGAVNWTGLTVPANGTLTLTVVVSVNTTIPPGVTQIGNVAYETGTTPPSCPPAGPQCVITPTAASVSTVKLLSGESGSQPGVAEPGEQLTYSITLTNTGGSAALNYAETDRLDPNTTFVSASNGGVFSAGVVNWTGLTVPAGGSVTLTVVVSVNSPIPPGVTQIGNVAYQTGTTPPSCPPGGPQCVIVPTAAAVTIGKTASAPTPTGVPNEYQITYIATATNSGGSVGNYDLSDTLTFNGATVTAITAPLYASSTGDTQTGVLGTLSPPSGGTIVTGESLNASGIETWTYTVTYQITDPATASDCSVPNGGLRNSAALGGASAGAPPAATCTGAPSVSIRKTAGAPVATGNANEFTLTYTVDVANTGTLGGVYDLADTLDFNGASVTAISAPAYSSSTGDTQDGTLGAFAAPNGGTIVTGEAISTGGAERWTYTVTYTVTDSAVAQDCTSPNGGLRNDAALGGSLSGESTTCTGAPAVVIGKSASGPIATGSPNEYKLTYLVTVQNNGTLPGVYDLDDSFTFPGVTVVSVGPVVHGGVDPLSTPLGTLMPTGGNIVTGESIAAHASETYTYNVVFTVDDVAAVGSCASGGGLVNHASLGGSSAGAVGTCSGVPDVAIVKTASAPASTGTPNQYSITYTVTVDNAGDASGTYDLADAFAFAGATVNAVSAITHGGPDPLITALGTLTAAGGTIVTGEPIGAGSSETYTYTVTFTITDPATANDCTNPAGGLRNAATLGGSATGEADTCTGAAIVTTAKALSGESGTQPGIAEPGETLTYTITLTNSGSVAATNQSVVDPLDANVTFVSADNGGALAGGNVTWSGLTVPANGNLVLTVVVTVANPIPAGVTEIGNVAYDPNVGPPDCTTTPTPPNCTITPTEADVTIVKVLSGESGTQPGVAEPGEQLTYTITLTNTGGSDAINYSTTDTLDPNVGFVSADNGGALVGGNVVWNGLTVPAGGNLVLTVIVSVNATIPPGVTQIGNVAYETGTTPPTCPPAGPQCVVIPTAGSVTIAKSVVDANGDGVAQAGEQLTYAITLTNGGGSNVTNYAVTDPLDPNVVFVSASNGGAFAGVVVTWTGLTVPANGNLVLTVIVTVVNPIPPGVTAIGNVAYQTGGSPPDCSAVPTPANCSTIPTDAQISIGKTASAPAPTGVPNQYRLTYTATVSNTGGSPGNYALSDTLTFNGATVTAISAPVYSSTTGDTQDGTLGTFAPPTGGTIVTGEDISVGGIETWTYTVTYTITDADLASDCSSALGGLRNSAALGGSNVFGPPAQTCTGAPSVAIQKTAAAPVPTGNPNEFTLTYTVNVSNAGSLAGVYDLSDVLTFNGANITAISAPAYSSSTGDTQDGTLGPFGLPDGGVIVTGENIAAGGAETWTYTVTYSITDAATADDCADPNGGLRNSAALGGAMSGQSTTCTGAPAVSIGKSASGPTATGNPNEYTLTYLVAVQNNGTLTGTYDLSDTFTLPGTSNVSVSAIQHNGPDPLATTLGTLLPSGGTIVTGETIAAGSSESYTYTVTFTIDAAAVGDCAAGGGLVNDAQLGGSSAGQVGTCSDVPNVAIAKSATTPTPTGTPNQYAMTYTVTASNTGFAVGTYDLADTFTFAGATIDAVSAVTHGGPDPLATTLGTLTAAGGTIVTGESVAGGSSETYAYTVTFTVTDPASANDCTDPNGGLRNAATLGGSATGSSATCNGAPSVTTAKVLSGESGSLPGVAEPGETLTYTITLTNAGTVDQTNYGVTDPLDPNVTFVSASNGGALTGGSVIWTGLTVPAGGNLVLTVVVTVNDPIPAGVTTIGNVAYQTGGTPPDCTATPTPPNCVITPAEGVVAIVKSVADANGNNIAEPGETLTYTITLTNTNGGDVTGYGVTDPLDANVTFVSASNGGTFAGGTVTWTGLAIPANSSLALTVVVTVNNPLPPGVTQIGNVAYETGGTPPDCTVNPRPANCTVIVTPSPGTITIVKAVADANGNGLAEPGETLTYTITLTNTNGGDVTGYGVTDPLDANVTFVSASNGGAFAGGTVTWTNLTIPANSSVALTVVVTVDSPLPPGVTQIGNLAYETGTTPPDCTTNPRPANCAVIVTPPPGNVAIAKSVSDANGNGFAEPGETLTYTITLTNSGGDVTGYGVTDPLDPNVVFVSADNGGTFAGSTVTWTNLTIPANGSLALTVVATVANPIPVGVTQIGNVAYQTGSTPPDCTAVPQPPSCVVIVTPPPAGAPELLIQKAVNTTSTTPGGTLVYTVTVSNVGTAAATNALITDPIPIGVASYAWTCAASGGAVCPNASGTGGIAETIATFPPGGVIVYTVTAQLEANPPATIANVASVTPPGLGTCAPSGTPPPCSSTVVVGVNPPVGGEPQPVPALNEWALLLLGLATLGVAWRATASNRRG